MPFSTILSRSWTLEFASKWLPYMSLASIVKLRRALIKGSRLSSPAEPLRLTLRRPIRGDIWIRNQGSDWLIFQEIVERKVYQCLLDGFDGCEYMIDLGANIGLTSRLLLAQHPRAKVLAVEPDPGNVEMLERNLADFKRVGRCQVKRAAVWGEAGVVHLTKPINGDSARISVANFSAVEDSRPHGGPSTSKAEAFTVEQIIADSGFPHVDILKLDIEGAEASIFGGSLDWLEKVHAIAIEFHGESRARSRFDEVIAAKGFEIKDTAGQHTCLALRKGGRWSAGGNTGAAQRRTSL